MSVRVCVHDHLHMVRTLRVSLTFCIWFGFRIVLEFRTTSGEGCWRCCGEGSWRRCAGAARASTDRAFFDLRHNLSCNLDLVIRVLQVARNLDLMIGVL